MKGLFKYSVIFGMIFSLCFLGCRDNNYIFDKETVDNLMSHGLTVEMGLPGGSADALIPKEYWGTWIRMDTGDKYYIDSKAVMDNSQKNVTSSFAGCYFETENILRKGDVVYFKKGGSNRDFSLKVSGFSDPGFSNKKGVSFSIGTGNQSIKGRRQNIKNSVDSETVSPDSTGEMNFTGAVADDTQEITISDGQNETTAKVTPSYDGENLGTIPLVEEGSYGFKTTYSIDGDEQGFCFGNNYRKYTLELSFTNVGSISCAAGEIEISCSDSNLYYGDNSLDVGKDNFSTIKPGYTRSFVLENITYKQLDTEYVDVPIHVSITDAKYGRTWKDSVTLRFYKGIVKLKVNALSFDSGSKANLNGFLIYPDGRSKRFEVSSGSAAQVFVPWSENDYMLAFSGATASTELTYSFGFSQKTSLATLDEYWSVSDLRAYESNDSPSTAYRITNLSSPVKAYLMDGDIDFYVINTSSVPLN